MPMMDASYALQVVQKIALDAALLIALAQLRVNARWFGPRARQAQLGLIIGIILIVGMIYPIHLPSGAPVYGGPSFVGVAGFLGGPIATAVTLALVMPFRLWLGGSYAASSITVLLLVAALSLLYRRAVMVWSEQPGYAHLPVLSLIVSLSAIAGLTLVPPMQRSMLLHQLGPAFGAGTFISAWLLAALLLYQQRRDAREGALDEARALLTSITGGFPGILYRRVLMPDGMLHYTYLSGAVEAMLGVGADEILADPGVARDRVHPEDQATVDEAMRRAAEALSPATIEHRILRYDGKMRWVRDISQPRRQADGAVVWDGCMVDVTETIRGEQALRDTEARMGTLLDLLRDAYVAADAQDRIIGWNDAAERLFGWSRNEALGRPLGEMLLPERDRHAHRRWLAHIADRGKGEVRDRHAVAVALHRDGSEFPVEYGFAVLQTGQGWTYHGVAHPIGEHRARKRAAE
ncbi:MAG: PAS domain-containing protein [Stellaceae bacterium]